MKILLGGALGRMGREVTAAAAEAQVESVCGVDVAYTGQPSDYPIVTAFDQATQKADVLIDFSRPSALPELLQLARKEKMPAVLCTPGYNEAELQMIEEASREIPVFRSANMSLGVNVLRHLVQEAARALGEDFDVEKPRNPCASRYSAAMGAPPSASPAKWASTPCAAEPLPANTRSASMATAKN